MREIDGVESTCAREEKGKREEREEREGRHMQEAEPVAPSFSICLSRLFSLPSSSRTLPADPRPAAGDQRQICSALLRGLISTALALFSPFVPLFLGVCDPGLLPLSQARHRDFILFPFRPIDCGLSAARPSSEGIWWRRCFLVGEGSATQRWEHCAESIKAPPPSAGT